LLNKNNPLKRGGVFFESYSGDELFANSNIIIADIFLISRSNE